MARPHALKAAAATIPLILEVEQHFPRPPPNLGFLRSTVDGYIALRQGYDQDVASFLHDVDGHLVRAVLEECRLDAKEAERVDAFRASMAGRAQAASRAAAACVADGERLAAGFPHLLPELDEAFDFAVEVAKGLLRPQNIALPQVRRHLGFGPALNGRCEVADDRTGPASDVTLVLPAGGLSSGDLYELPYVLAHELICHAAQGVSGPPPRTTLGPNCAWSDGWMDCVAYDAIVAWLTEADIGQPWIAGARTHIIRRAEVAHVARYDIVAATKSAEVDRQKRSAAKHAWSDLKLKALSQGRREEDAGTLRRDFSVLCNAVSLSIEARSALTLGLWEMLADDPYRALAAVDSFISAPDPAALQQAISLDN